MYPTPPDVTTGATRTTHPGVPGPVEEAVVHKLIEVMQLRDPKLAGHGQRTAQVAAALAEQLGLDRDALDRTFLAAQLHDIGKLGVSEAVLWKPAGLSRTEWRVIRSHPEDGHRLVADVVHHDVATAVLYHHERMDGQGYPFGIAGRTLQMPTRIVQVADAFDAMTSDRPYERALPIGVAVAEITRCAGTQFDADVARALHEIFGDMGDVIDIRPGTVVAADPFAPTSEAG
jgi:HD-GYP domain-containing protein (c-di-GMP phosphodiesterase class II)